MTLHSLARLLRPTAVLLLVAGMLLLGARSAVWATPAQGPYGQTVPTKTPGPKPAKTPKPTKSPQATKTPKPTKTPDQAGGSCSHVSSQAPVSRDAQIALAVCPWSVSAAGAAFTSDGTLELQLAAADAVPKPNVGDTFIGPQADLTLFDPAGNPIAQPALAKPIEVCYSYAATELAHAAGDPGHFILQVFDANAQIWTDRSTSVDASNSRVCALTPHLSLFALTIRLRPSMLPRTAASAGPAVGIWFLGVIALALVTGLVLRLPRRKLAAGTLSLGEPKP